MCIWAHYFQSEDEEKSGHTKSSLDGQMINWIERYILHRDSKHFARPEVISPVDTTMPSQTFPMQSSFHNTPLYPPRESHPGINLESQLFPSQVKLITLVHK